ncbi:MAG: hypothetical protein KAS32_12355 [Candidatus Peribacteraceae bacterium]|nr:hypothetical protein [Candidatus Peribacteraceae bacterium]
MYRDLERVKALAQVTANLSKVNQKVYEIKCEGLPAYRFSDNWKGKVIAIVQPHEQHTSKTVLSDSGKQRPESTGTKKRRTGENKQKGSK